MLHRSAPARVVAVTQDDPFFTGAFFRTFLAAADRRRVCLEEIVLLPNFSESRAALLRRLAGLYGPVGVGRLALRYGWAQGRELLGTPRSVEAIATRYGIPVRALDSINDERYLRTLRERRVDVLLSVAAPEIFRAAALAATPHALNVHNGRLPDFRGMLPTFWALHRGDDEIVVTVHEMAEALDAGRVVAEFPVAVSEGESQFSVSVRAKLVAGERVARLLGTLDTPAWPTPHAIDAAEGSYNGFPGRREARELRAVGRRLL